MKSYIDIFRDKISAEFLEKHTVALMERELPQTTPAQHRAADYIYDLVRDNGLEAERYNFISDGKNVCYDAALPMAWDVSYATLSVVSEWDGERVIADYQKEPFAVVRYSVPTPPEGITTRVVSWDKMMDGDDVEGAFVLVPYGQFVTARILVPILDRGAIGFIGGTVSSREEKPDSTHWINGATETNSWCVNENERDFIGFSVTPKIHSKLTEACKNGEVIVKAQTDAHRYVGEMPAVTALLPGKSERELWVIAHTAEPLEDDNNAGVIGIIHALISIKKAVDEGKLPKPKYSIRLMLSPEAYGLCAFGKHFGEVLYDRCIGAVNVDGIPTAFDSELVRLQFAPSPVPFFGNVVMEGIWRTYASVSDESPYIDEWWGDHWDDDCFLSDITVGLPTIMPETVFYSWHNSTQRYGYIDYAKFARSLWVYTAMIAAIAVSEADILEKFLPMAAEYAEVRLKEIADTCPPREGTNARDRLNFWKKIEIANVRAFSGEGVSESVIRSVCDKIEEYANSLETVPAEPKTEETPVFDSFEDIVITRNSIGVPRDLMRIPLERRWHPFDKTFMNRVFCLCDGKKTLKTVVTEAEWENKRAKSEEQLSNFLNTLELLAEFEYIKLERK